MRFDRRDAFLNTFVKGMGFSGDGGGDEANNDLISILINPQMIFFESVNYQI